MLVGWTDASPPERFAAGRRLLADLARELGGPESLTVISRCAVCGGDHGRPVDPSGRFALSVGYAAGLVAAAAVPATVAPEVGVDVERTAPASTRDSGELASLFAPRPAPDLRGWTAIEAVLKADGRGLLVPPDRVVFTGAPGVLLGDGRLATVPGAGGSFEVVPVPAPEGFVISVAIGTAWMPGS
ncbi:4'-phosphopantetheinyl transferase family protein [Microbacterium invictum]|uniref:4'-phosphopantetheinyl transferase n=1 Tax=Microbacterium invictum TaxID=515415 RepID=A0AA40SSB5_9MICO|nr:MULTISPECIES: 4-phosphopantetheinyl transferase [Microbacterium]MBB4141356.1 4'-phosphopantetheinyl transferase [Microbacterium invictum]